MLLDGFDESDLDFEHWVSKMVEDGRLYRPEVSSREILFVREDGWYVKVQNAGCAALTGNQELLSKTQEHFCNDFVKGAATIYAQAMETDVQNTICGDGRVCKVGVRAAMNFFEVNKSVEDITNACHQMFTYLNDACPDGGVAEVEIGDDSGAEPQTGQLESMYELDTGPTCQTSNTQECFNRDVPA